MYQNVNNGYINYIEHAQIVNMHQKMLTVVMHNIK